MERRSVSASDLIPVSEKTSGDYVLVVTRESMRFPLE
jgi:hypothetical protein